MTYLGLLFWHAGNVLDSWAYLYAMLALWLTSWLARTFWDTRPLNIKNSWFIGAPTTLTQLPGQMTRLEVLAPPDFHHSPAQYCFLRFPSLSPLDNHPFTIASAPQSSTQEDKPQTLIFLARTHDGFTKRLSKYAAEPDRHVYAWIEGP